MFGGEVTLLRKRLLVLAQGKLYFWKSHMGNNGFWKSHICTQMKLSTHMYTQMKLSTHMYTQGRLSSLNSHHMGNVWGRSDIFVGISQRLNKENFILENQIFILEILKRESHTLVKSN